MRSTIFQLKQNLNRRQNLQNITVTNLNTKKYIQLSRKIIILPRVLRNIHVAPDVIDVVAPDVIDVVAPDVIDVVAPDVIDVIAPDVAPDVVAPDVVDDVAPDVIDVAPDVIAPDVDTSFNLQYVKQKIMHDYYKLYNII